MKAYQISKHAHPKDIPLTGNVALPKAKSGQVVVDVYAAALNFFDVLQAQGKYQTQPPLPFVLGAEFSGKIAKDSPIPPGCRYKPGDRVFGFAQGAYAEQVLADYKTLLPIPKGVTYEQAAVVPLTYTTSYEGLLGRGQAKAGEWVLVHAGAGGVGLAAVQIAKAIGCKVIATASTAQKREICKVKGGADEVVDYSKDNWPKEVMRITGNKGVNVVFDPVGKLIPSLKCVAWGARIVVVGFAGGPIEKVPANLLLLKSVSLVGLYWGPTFLKDPQRASTVLKELLELLATKKIVPAIYEPLYEGLETVSQGLVDLDERKIWGRGVVRVRKDDGGEGVKAKL